MGPGPAGRAARACAMTSGRARGPSAARRGRGGAVTGPGPALALLAGAEPKRGPALALQPQTDGPACQWMLLSESPAVASDFV